MPEKPLEERDDLVERNGLEGYASQRHNTRVEAPGDFSLLQMRTGIHWNLHRLAIIGADDERRSFAVVRHPMLAEWMTCDLSDPSIHGFMRMDIFDAMWACRPWVGYATKEQAVAVTLMRLGFVAPTVTTNGRVQRIRQWVKRAEANFELRFLDETDMGTETCTGCERCGDGVRFHRVESYA